MPTAFRCSSSINAWMSATGMHGISPRSQISTHSAVVFSGVTLATKP